VKLRTSIILAGAAVAALAVSGTAGASTTAGHPHSVIPHATLVKPGAITHIHQSGGLGVKTTRAYADVTRSPRASGLTSSNWSGYVTPEDAGEYDGTSITFTVPEHTTCAATNTMSSFWAGIDGWGDSTVEQDGIEDDCTDGVRSMYAWIEDFPAPEEEIVNEATGDPAPVEPGDTIVTSVAEVTPTEYSMAIDDETQRWAFAGYLDMPSGYTGDDLTSEVIAEATSLCTATTCTIQPLTDFGSVTFSDNYFFTPTTTDYFTSADSSPIELYQNGVETDDVGSLGAEGAFTVSYGAPPAADKVTVTSPGNQSTTAGVKASLQIHATSSLGEALSYAAVGLPPGLSINSSTGLITGTPTDTGTYSVAVAASDPGGHTGSASFTWTIKKLAAPKPRLCGRSGTVIHVCWPAVPDATRYYGLLAGHGHNFSTAALHETFRGLKRRHSYKLEMHASDTASASATVVLTVRTK